MFTCDPGGTWKGSQSLERAQLQRGWAEQCCCFLLHPCALAGSGKNDSAEKVAEKLEALSVKAGTEPQDEAKQPAEEEQ